MRHPVLYEVNTRCWLNGLSAQAGVPVTLASVPDGCLEEWVALGFTHIWLMGVWKTGPMARTLAREEPGLVRFARGTPGLLDSDLDASPYAIADYVVPEALGGDSGLTAFRERLHARGLRLVMDFVPNHAGLDHNWVKDRPEFFVHAGRSSIEGFQILAKLGPQVLAHGKDPYFPAWKDTVQFEYRRPQTRAAMTRLLRSVAARCDGLRCDMAMLVLKDVFERTWAECPCHGAEWEEEFWSGAIAQVKQDEPGFEFIAEVYWGLDERLRSMGFDFTYDKELYDCIVSRDAAGLCRHLYKGCGADVANGTPHMASEGALASGVHFLENHDERRIAAVLPFVEHRAVSMLGLCLPGMRFLHQGQLEGAAIRTPVQFTRFAAETPNLEIAALYGALLPRLRDSDVGKGSWRLVVPEAASGADAGKCPCVVAAQWSTSPDSEDIALINLASTPCRCVFGSAVMTAARGRWVAEELFASGGVPLAAQGDGATKALVCLDPYEARLIRIGLRS